MIIIFFTHIVYAKYVSMYKIKSSNSIEMPILVIEGDEILKINEINNIGYYKFSIKNFNEINISETSFLYTIEILSNTDESIQFELYRDEEQIPLKDLKTDKLLIQGNEKIEQKYELKIIYDETKEGNEINEKVQIRVYSEQKMI